MIASKDRSYFFGASDSDKIIGKWTSNTWQKWWMQKIGINTDHFENKYTMAGNNFERKILESLGLPLEFDKQIILEDLRLRVNLDGNTDDCIYECKTFIYEKGFKLPKKYINQVQVQMFASGIRKAKIIAYGLKDEDYNNYFKPIDKGRILEFDIEYDEQWINNMFLPKLRTLVDCLKRGVMPYAA